MARTVLVIGYGNPGRQDDGLGPILADRIAARGCPDVQTDATYQLTVEDAAAVAEHDAVIFVDAALDGAEPFMWRRLAASEPASFSTHSCSPGAVVALAETLFDWRAEAWLLGIRGYEFEKLEERLTPAGWRNLAAAEAFLVHQLARWREGGHFDEKTPISASADEEASCKTASTSFS